MDMFISAQLDKKDQTVGVCCKSTSQEVSNMCSCAWSPAHCTATDSGRIRKRKRFLLWQVTRYWSQMPGRRSRC